MEDSEGKSSGNTHPPTLFLSHFPIINLKTFVLRTKKAILKLYGVLRLGIFLALSSSRHLAWPHTCPHVIGLLG